MTRLLLLLTAEAAVCWAMTTHAATHLTDLADRPGAWDVPLASVAPVGLRTAGAVAAAALLVGTMTEVVRAARGRRPSRMAPRWLRRLADHAVGATLLLTISAAPAVAAVPTTPSPSATDLSPDFTDPDPGAVPPPQPPPGLPPLPLPGADGAGEDDVVEEDPPSAGPAAEGAADQHVVAPGENLWVIARGQLIGAGRPAPDDRTVHAYWVRVIAANADGLRSGNPDLIHPGERLVLPPIEESGP